MNLHAVRLKRPQWLTSVAGLVGLLVVWQVAATTVFSKSGSVPSPTEIVRQMTKDGFEFYWNNATTTFSARRRGCVWTWC